MLNFSDLLLGCEDTEGDVNIMKCCIATSPKDNMLLHVHGSVMLLTATCGLQSEGYVIEFPCNSVYFITKNSLLLLTYIQVKWY